MELELEEVLKESVPESVYSDPDVEKLLFSYLLKETSLAGSVQDDCPVSSLYSLLGTFGPRQVCQYMFKRNDIVWTCRQCQRDATCVLCNDCFQHSDHEGHEVYFYHSTSGGCCDCGDADAWRATGFCSRHGRGTEDPKSHLPSELVASAQPVLSTLSHFLAQLARDYASLFTADDSLDASQWKDDRQNTFLVFHPSDAYKKTDEVEHLFELYVPIPDDMVRDRVEKLVKHRQRLKFQMDLPVLRSMHPSAINNMIEQMRNRRFTVALVPAEVLERENWAYKIIEWLRKIANSNDGMCKLITEAFIENDAAARILEVFPLLHADLCDKLHNFLIALMADIPFKQHVAVAYARVYEPMSRLYVQGAGLFDHSVYDIAVQFLNRHALVQDIVVNHGFFQSVMGALDFVLDLATENEEVEIHASWVLKSRRYNPLINDLKTIFYLPDMSRLFLAQNLPALLRLLLHFEYLHPQRRRLDVHVEHETDEWLSSFNTNISLGFMYDPFLKWISSEPAEQWELDSAGAIATSNERVEMVTFTDVEGTIATLPNMNICTLVKMVWDVLGEWQRKFTEDLDKDTELIVQSSRHSQPMVMVKMPADASFHLPTHRFLAAIVKELSLCPQHCNSVDAVMHVLKADSQRLLTTTEIPLQCLALSSQVQRRWWVRNGTSMLDQSANYAELHICRVFRDLDLLLLQICGTARDDMDSFLTVLLYRFDVLSVFSTDKEPDPGMLEEVLILITQILTELPVHASLLDQNSRESKASIRRELIHKLAIGPLTFSELHDTVYRASEISKLVEEVILDISDSRDVMAAGTVAVPKRVLKPEMWREYDPCYFHYLPTTHQKAIDYRPPVTSPQPMVASPIPAHSSFKSLRESVLSSKAVFLPLLKKLTLAAAKMRIGSAEYQCVSVDVQGDVGQNLMNIFSRVLQLLTLTIHILDGLNDGSSSGHSITATGSSHSDGATMAVEDELSSGNSVKENAKKELAEFFLSQESVPRGDTESSLDASVQPHLLGALVDLQFALASDASEINISNWLKWLLTRIASLSAACDAYVRSRQQSADQERKKAELELRKKRAREKAMSAMKQSAQAFASHMDESNDNEEGEECGETSKNATGQKGTEDDIPNDPPPPCIICQLESDSEDPICYLGFCQISRQVFHPLLPVVLHESGVDEDELNEPKSRTATPPHGHISFCGHCMHSKCFDKFLESEYSRLSDFDRRQLIDRAKLEFLCPLCKRISNRIVPHISQSGLVDRAVVENTIASASDRNIVDDMMDFMKNLVFSDASAAQDCQSQLDFSLVIKILERLGKAPNFMYLPQSWWVDIFSCQPRPSEFQEFPSCLLVIVNHIYYSCLSLHLEDATKNSDETQSGKSPGGSDQRQLKKQASFDSRTATGVSAELPAQLEEKSKGSANQWKILSHMVKFLAIAVGKISIRYAASSARGSLHADIIDSLFCAPQADVALEDFPTQMQSKIPLKRPILTFNMMESTVLLLCTFVGPSVVGNTQTSDPESLAIQNHYKEVYRSVLCYRWLSLAHLCQLVLGEVVDVAAGFEASLEKLRQKVNAMSSDFQFVMKQPVELKFGKNEDDNKKEESSAQIATAMEIKPSASPSVQMDTGDVKVAVETKETSGDGEEGLISSRFFEDLVYAVTERISTQLCPHVNREKFLYVDESTGREMSFLFRSVSRYRLEYVLDRWSVYVSTVSSLAEHLSWTSRDVQLLFGRHDDCFREQLELADLFYPAAGSSHQELISATRGWVNDYVREAKIFFETTVDDRPYSDPFYSVAFDYMQCHGLPRGMTTLSSPSRPRRLIRLPHAYTQFHANVSAINSASAFQFPAICLSCGRILDGSGKSNCSKHLKICGGDSGIFFLLQDHQLLFLYGVKGCYYSSPYVDEHGESHRNSRGKPLYLDTKRYELVQTLWREHKIPSEVIYQRSAASHVIIQGYY